jgi:hypothetical protein
MDRRLLIQPDYARTKKMWGREIDQAIVFREMSGTNASREFYREL